MIGPYLKNRIVLCSADASPKSQRNRPCEAAYFFPGAKWVGAIRNAAKRLTCRFVILTSYGIVDPEDEIEPYDLHIYENMQQIRENWGGTIPHLIGGNQYDIMVFYPGGCPDITTNVLSPILHANNMDLITFGKPNMCDIDKVDDIVKLLTIGITLDDLRKVLKYPDRLRFLPHS